MVVGIFLRIVLSDVHIVIPAKFLLVIPAKAGISLIQTLLLYQAYLHAHIGPYRQVSKKLWYHICGVLVWLWR